MSPSEISAYNVGVLAVLEIAATTAKTIRSQSWKPTREGAAGALAELAEAGRALLIDPEPGDEKYGSPPAPIAPNDNPSRLRGPASPAIAISDISGDGKFGLNDEEIARPTRRILADWLYGRIPMLAPNWPRRAGLLLEADGLRAARMHFEDDAGAGGRQR